MSYWRLFARLIVRPLSRELIRTALTVFAVALGVAVVIAIGLASESAAGSFHASLESLTGANDLVISATGGIDEQLLGQLAQLPEPFEYSPRIEEFAFLNGKGDAIPFLGLDLIGHRPEQSHGVFRSGAPLLGVWASAEVGVQPGASVRLLINDAFHEFTVAGTIPARGAKVFVADIEIAQETARKMDRLDGIDVRVPSSYSTEKVVEILRRYVPAGVQIEPAGARTEENRQMLTAFRWNLTALSYIALVVGAFLIYNTISISVVRRRAEIGIARAIGASRTLIAAGFLAEALFFGVLGGIVGVALGRGLAVAAVGLIGSTVKSLYVSGEPGSIQWTWETILTGAGLGLAVSLLAALGPAIEASRVPPAEAMARGRVEYRAIQNAPAAVWIALFLFAAAFGLSRLPAVHGRPIFASLAALLLIAGASSAIPPLIEFSSAWTQRPIRRWFGPEAMLALRGLRASLGRTSALAAALSTAVAMTAAVGIMVGSFRQTLTVWIEGQLHADFYLRPAGTPSADRHPTMGIDIAQRLAQVPGVERVDSLRAYPISYQGLPATLSGATALTGLRFLSGENSVALQNRWASGDYAVVSEPFANKHHMAVGDRVTLPLAGGSPSFTVLGIYYEYSSERGFILLSRQTLLRYLPDPAISNLAVYVKPGSNSDLLRRELDKAVSGRAILIFPNSALRRAAILIFDRTFRITYALEAVAVFVAVMGIAGALLAMVIDRRREFAILRFLGASRTQIRAIILCEAGLLGLISNAVGFVLGVILSLILIFVINKQSFGWTLQFSLPAVLLLSALTVIFVATVLAGLYPARAALALNPVEAAHED